MPGKMARSDPRPSVRVTRCAGSGQDLASVLQERQENANIDAGLGFIWRISVPTSSAAFSFILRFRRTALALCCHISAVTTRRDMLGCQRLEGMGCRISEVLARPRIVLTPRAKLYSARRLMRDPMNLRQPCRVAIAAPPFLLAAAPAWRII
jgi:hypothetical protein